MNKIFSIYSQENTLLPKHASLIFSIKSFFNIITKNTYNLLTFFEQS